MRTQTICEHGTLLREPIREKLPDNHGCIHGALIRGDTTGGGLPDHIITYYCSVCGYPHLVGPIRLFKHHPAAIKMFDALQEQIQYDLSDIIMISADGHVTKVLAYFCNVCALGFLTSPIEKFKHNANAKKFFAKVANDIKNNIPELPSKAGTTNKYVDQDLPTMPS